MKRIFVQATLAACCLAATSCGQPQQQQMAPSTYEVMTIATSDRVVPTAYSATIRGRQDIEIYPQVGGTITSLNVNEGEKVTKGQTLMVIDQVPYKAALQTAEANVQAAKASVSTAQLTYDSKKELLARNVVSQHDATTAHNQLLSAQAQLAQAEAQRVNAANNLSYSVVKSPVNGVVGTLPYRVGALVSASIQKPLTTVSDNSTMYVYFSMTENQLLALTREFGSMENTIKSMPEVTLMLSDGSEHTSKGRVESISGIIDPNTGSTTLRAAFNNQGNVLLSGSSGSVVMPSTYKDCVVIPQSASFDIQNKTFAYKVVDGKAVAAPLVVEKITNGREYIVRSGLSVGDVIVAEGVGLMREGTPIVAKTAATQAAETAPAVDAGQNTEAEAQPQAAQTEKKQ